MASKSKSQKREKHAVYFVVHSEQAETFILGVGSDIISGPEDSKSAAVKVAEQRISESNLVGPFALLKTRTDVVATFDVQTVTVNKLAKL